MTSFYTIGIAGLTSMILEAAISWESFGKTFCKISYFFVKCSGNNVNIALIQTYWFKKEMIFGLLKFFDLLQIKCAHVKGILEAMPVLPPRWGLMSKYLLSRT